MKKTIKIHKKSNTSKWFKVGVFALIMMLIIGTFSCYAAPKTSSLKSPTITWTTPANIEEGTPLSELQLNAVAKYRNVVIPGTYIYDPSIGTILPIGNNQQLKVTFDPDDIKYKTVSKTVYINVTPKEIIKQDPIITWNQPDNITYGTLLTDLQLNAISNVDGTFNYEPSLGTKLEVGIHTLNVTFTPTDTVNYNEVSKNLTIEVTSVYNPPIPNYDANVKDFGAKGDGITDDTSAINLAIGSVGPLATVENRKTIYIPDGTYMIDPLTSLRLYNNINLILADNAILQAKPVSSDSYSIIKMWKKSNITISGGAIVGERYAHLGTSGEWGFGISLWGCNNITIKDTSIVNCWGDGIYVGSADDGPTNPTSIFVNKNIVIDHVYIENNRRDNISIISVDGLLVRNSTLVHANGNPPECGINFEPNYPQLERVTNVILENLTTKDNVLYGIQLGAFMFMYQMPVDITIINHQSINDGQVIGPWNSYYDDKVITNNVPANAVNIKDYGVLGNGIEDETLKIQSVINSLYNQGGGNIYIPDGTYLINPDVSIRMKNNVNLYLSKNAILKALPSANTGYYVILMWDVSNSKIIGGQIIGDRDIHLGTTGEWGHGIAVRGCNNIYISDISISNCWGDGIYIGSSDKQHYSADITIENYNLNNNRRQGISVISAKRLLMKNGIISNTNGTPPARGIDFEPNRTWEFMQDINVEGLRTYNNQGTGIGFWLENIKTTTELVSINIKDYIDSGSLATFNGQLTSDEFTKTHVTIL